MATSTFADDVVFQGNVTFTGSVTTLFNRTQLVQDNLASFPIKLTDWRVWDAMQTNLPGTAASDDLGLIATAYGTVTPVIRTSDAKATTVTQRMRALCHLPESYQAGETVTVRVFAGMDTTISDGTATVDVECYEADHEGGLGSDLCSTAATSINSLTNAARDFQITASGLTAGDILDIRVTIAITDAATATAVLGEIGYVSLLCDIKG